MKWIPFIILAIITITCQTTVVQAMAIRTQGNVIWPDWMFILATHYALWGPMPDVAIAAWLLGLGVDIHTEGRIGLFAFLYGAAAWLLLYIRQALYRENAVTQVILTLIMMFLVQAAALFYTRWASHANTTSSSLWLAALYTAVYTAACAPYLHWLLLRMGRWTGLKTGRRSG